MSLSKNEIIDNIEVVGDEIKSVQVRKAIIILENGEEINRSFERHSIVCVDDYSSEDPQVQAICNVVFTEAMRTAYQQALVID